MSSAEGFAALPGDERAHRSHTESTRAMRPDCVTRCCTASRPVVPGSRLLGRARTVRFAPSLADDALDPYRDAIEVIDGIRAGQVVVIATDRSNDSAFWGELFSAAALGAGAAGVITDGNLRDTERIAAMGFPAFRAPGAPSTSARDCGSSTSTSRWCSSGVEIRPGDLVMADDDGVVVIPRRHEDCGARTGPGAGGTGIDRSRRASERRIPSRRVGPPSRALRPDTLTDGDDMTFPVIDAHQHVWDPARAEYDWSGRAVADRPCDDVRAARART